MDPKTIDIRDFTYDLPLDRIAAHPLAQRDASRLLVYHGGRISEDRYCRLSEHLPKESLMVFNNTKVVEARLLFQKETGGVIEIFCLEPDGRYPDLTTAMAQTGQVRWRCLVGGASKWNKGRRLRLPFRIADAEYMLEAAYLEKKGDSFVIGLEWNAPVSFAELLHYAGHVPLPPYIKRPDEAIDKTRYQTVFAKYDGSVAAPTAGLHFTREVLGSLERRGIHQDFVTLHVGAGTFKPVKAETMELHEMHAEYIEVHRDLIERLRTHYGKPVVAVGTTSMRTLESLYWLGCRLFADPDAFTGQLPFVDQWVPYGRQQLPEVPQALSALLHYMEACHRTKLIAKTKIIIAPGYTFRIVNGLVTNFHQPASTLLLLVAAFIGEDWKKVYAYALDNNFRFLSYGDGSLLWQKED